MTPFKTDVQYSVTFNMHQIHNETLFSTHPHLQHQRKYQVLKTFKIICFCRHFEFFTDTFEKIGMRPNRRMVERTWVLKRVFLQD